MLRYKLQRTAVIILSLGLLVPSAALLVMMPASATSTADIASLALDNVGMGAGSCSTANNSANSLGGNQFESSCTGYEGSPEFWCADFVKWVWQNASGGAINVSGLDAAAGSFYLYGASNGTLHTSASYRPQVGDAIVYHYQGAGLADHVGLVTSVNSDGSIGTVNGDWGGVLGQGETKFAETSTVQSDTLPASEIAVGSNPNSIDMTISAYVSPVGVTPVPSTTPEFYVHNGYELGSLYRYPIFPSVIDLDNTDSITGLKWTRVSPTSANAAGTLHSDNCKPNCAAGTVLTYPVELAASNPQRCTVKVYYNGTDPGIDQGGLNNGSSRTVSAYVFDKTYVQVLSGNPPSYLVGNSPTLPPACNVRPSAPPSPTVASSAPCTSTALTSAINSTNTQPGGWKVLRFACQSGYSFISINPRTGGMQAVAILQQNGSSWKVIYGPNEGLCLTEPKLCPDFKLPLQRAILRSLMQKIG